MTDDQRSEVQALLVRAATAEAQRQSARDRRDWPAVSALEDELRRLWQRHSELETRERVAGFGQYRYTSKVDHPASVEPRQSQQVRQ